MLLLRSSIRVRSCTALACSFKVLRSEMANISPKQKRPRLDYESYFATEEMEKAKKSIPFQEMPFDTTIYVEVEGKPETRIGISAFALVDKFTTSPIKISELKFDALTARLAKCTEYYLTRLAVFYLNTHNNTIRELVSDNNGFQEAIREMILHSLSTKDADKPEKPTFLFFVVNRKNVVTTTTATETVAKPSIAAGADTGATATTAGTATGFTGSTSTVSTGTATSSTDTTSTPTKLGTVTPSPATTGITIKFGAVTGIASKTNTTTGTTGTFPAKASITSSNTTIISPASTASQGTSAPTSYGSCCITNSIN
ncbi:hypothetical protein BGW36DRAFT_377952 [Talaromyces proteolyticus]|uniref:Uncharacterized protein n=1 Tax=Talaromyces proteolyticus TaxID=1131652 RepID=A0AAD4KQX8_9EURO|nr:uncharacterized protein BGW36DRAFT_377952 [Talaromyces proteolyticus]KAH8697108.1 hypothetical protein BGW36DRAFT_377952 [Talaromyces proteolyticus]